MPEKRWKNAEDAIYIIRRKQNICVDSKCKCLIKDEKLIKADIPLVGGSPYRHSMIGMDNSCCNANIDT